MSAESQRPDEGRGNRAWTLGIAAVVVLLVIAVAVAMATRDDGDAEVADAPTEGVTQIPTAAATEASDAPTPAPLATTSPDAAPSEVPTQPQAAQPSEEQIAEFVDTYGPGDHTATGDIDGDGVNDVAIASTKDETTRLDVGFWDGTAFTHHADEGGPAQVVDALTIADYNGVPGGEVVTGQSVGEAGVSLSVWGGGPQGLERQTGNGGCWDGFHTYGISGATIEPGTITATCDGSPLPPEAWSYDVYEWRKGVWRHTDTIEPEE